VLVLPRVLGLLNDLWVRPSRWRALGAALADADPQRRATLAGKAKKIIQRGDLWDFLHSAGDDVGRLFSLPDAVFDLPTLEPLTSRAAMRAEARRMKNCLDDEAADAVAAGRAICFRPRDRAPVTAEIVQHGALWHVGRILGPGNAATHRRQRKTVQVELQRLADQLNAGAQPPGDDLRSDPIQKIRAWSRARYSAATIDSIARILGEIHGKSASWVHGAFATLLAGMDDGETPYVQLMASPTGQEFLFETASPRYIAAMHGRLNERTVSLLERAGFMWPRGRQNFRRWFSVVGPEDLTALAEIALAMLDRVCGLRPGASIYLRGDIPHEEATPDWHETRFRTDGIAAND